MPVLKPDAPARPRVPGRAARARPDVCPVVAYGAMLPQSALDIPAHGWINLHFSILPAWRGAAPVQHSIWAGDEMTGATTFRIVKALDAGPTFGVMTERIRPTDTAGDLLGRLAEGGAGLLVRTLDGIEDGSLEAREQPGEGSASPRRSWSTTRRSTGPTPPSVSTDRFAPALPVPVPGAPGEGERFKLGPLTVATDRERLDPGLLEVTKNAVFVGTATHPVELGEVKAFGKKQMRAADWARGVTVPEGARLGFEASA